MIEILGKYKKIVIVIELVVFVLLSLLMIQRMRGNNIFDIDLASMSTGHDVMKYDGTSWYLKADDANDLVSDGYIVFGPNMPLEKGTYTLVLNYKTTAIQKGVVEVDNGVIDTVDYFLLSNNKNEVRYDFTLKTHTDSFRFRLKEYLGGDFELDGMTVIRNTHDIRIKLFLWMILSIIVDLFIFSEKMRKNINTIALVIGIGLFTTLPIFSKGILTGNDIRFHLLRLEALVTGLKSGDFPVKMYSVFNDGYGFPVGILYGDLLLYIPSVLRIIGFGIMDSYKIYIFLTNVLASGTAYYCGRKIFQRKETAAMFSLVYTVGTYRLLCVYCRAAVGEFTASCFYPLIILAVWKIYTDDVKRHEYKKNAVILALGMTGMIYSHVLSTEMFALTLIVLALVLYKRTFRKETICVYITAAVISLALSAAFIFPFLEYYTGVDTMLNSSEFESTYIQDSGANLSEYFAFFKNITGAEYPLSKGIHTPGLIFMVALGIGLFLIFTKQADKRIKVVTVGAIVSLFVASVYFPWNMIYEVPVLGKLMVSVQFPYRYIGVASCFLSLLLGLGIEKMIELNIINRKAIFYSAFVSMIMTVLFLSRYQDEQHITSILRSEDTADLFVYTRPQNFGIYLGYEYLLEGSNISTEVLDYGVYGENVKAAIVSEKGLEMEIHVVAEKNAKLEIPRFAYPYFGVWDADGNKMKMTRGNNNKVTVLFEKPYSGTIYVDFKEPWHWRLAEIISLVSVLVLIIYDCKARYKRTVRE